MGFLFDNLKNLVGDIECVSLALNQGVSERSCDRYTGAKTTSHSSNYNSSSTMSNIKTSNTTNSKSNGEDKTDLLREADNTAKELNNLLKDTVVIMNKGDEENYKHRTELVGNDAKQLFYNVYNKLSKICDSVSANILANTVASVILDGEEASSISLDTILQYCKNANIASESTVKAMDAFANNSIKEIIHSTKIYETNDANKMVKPITMDFSSLINSNQPVLVG